MSIVFHRRKSTGDVISAVKCILYIYISTNQLMPVSDLSDTGHTFAYHFTITAILLVHTYSLPTKQATEGNAVVRMSRKRMTS